MSGRGTDTAPAQHGSGGEMRSLGLHQITAMEASPAELVSIAADVGCQQVCVFTYVPAVALPDQSGAAAFPIVTETTKRLSPKWL